MDALDSIVLPRVLARLSEIRATVADARTFLFGSITTERRPARDVDVLVVCARDSDGDEVRALMSPVSDLFPIHLLIMTVEEQAEVNFVVGVGALEVRG